MKNPWEEIDLTDYESHMKLASVMQLQAMDAMMEKQVTRYPAKTIMILGIAAGTGLQHIRPDSIEKLYGVDINRQYMEECRARYPQLRGILELIRADLTEDTVSLPHADLVIANLVIEYIGYGPFQRAIQQMAPAYVSCGIQINTDAGFVSDSPYNHVFDHLDSVHHQMDEQALEEAMEAIGYSMILRDAIHLPNGKKLVRLDFQRQR